MTGTISQSRWAAPNRSNSQAAGPWGSLPRAPPCRFQVHGALCRRLISELRSTIEEPVRKNNQNQKQDLETSVDMVRAFGLHSETRQWLKGHADRRTEMHLCQSLLCSRAMPLFFLSQANWLCKRHGRSCIVEGKERLPRGLLGGCGPE